MAVVGDLVATLSLNNSQFNKGIEQSRTRLQKFQRGVGNMRRDLERAGKQFSIFAGVAAAALGVVTTRTLETQDQLGKLARRIGATTEGLSKLQFAAEQTGVKTEALNMGLQRMVRRVSEAAQGTGEAQDALKQLGLSAQELAKLKAEDQFRRIAGAMQGVESQSEKVRIAFKLFDSEGVSLLQTMEDGVEGLDRFARQAEETGSVITDKQARAAAQARDAMNLLSRSFQGAANVMASNLAPAITAIANGFSQKLSKGLKDSRTAVVNWGSVVGDMLAFMADAGVGALATLKFGFESLGLTIGATAAAIAAITRGEFSQAKNIMTALAGDIKKAKDDLLATDLTGFRDELEKVRRKNEELGDGIRKTGDIAIQAGKKMKDAQASARKEVESTLEKIKDIEDDLLSQEESIRQSYRRRIDIVKDAADRRIIEESRANKLIEDLREKQAEELAKLEETKGKKVREEAEKSASKTQKIWDNATENIQRAWGDTWTDIFRGGVDSFRDFADKVKDIVARMAGEMVSVITTRAIQPIVQKLTGINFGDLLGGGGGLGSVVDAVTGNIGSVLSGINKKLGGFGGTILGGISGFGLGQLIGGQFGGQTESSIGGALGGTIGSMFGGPLGSALGSFGGSFIGSGLDRLFSGDSSLFQRATGAIDVLFPGIGSALGSLFGSEPDDPELTFRTGGQGTRFFKGSQAESPFGTVGLAPGIRGATEHISGGTARRVTKQIAEIDKQIAKFLTEAQVDAVATALQTQVGAKRIVGAGKRVEPGKIQNALRHRFETVFEAIGEEMPEAIRKARGTEGVVKAGLGELQKIFAAHVRSITDEMNAVTSQLQGQVSELLQFREGFARAGESIEQQLFSMTGTSASPLSPTERLKNARSQFEDLVARAQGGDVQALQQVSGSAQNFLGLARSSFASSPEFFERFDFVQQNLQSLQGVISQQQSRIDSTLGDLNVEVNRQTQMTVARLDSLIEATNQQSERLDELADKLERLEAA